MEGKDPSANTVLGTAASLTCSWLALAAQSHPHCHTCRWHVFVTLGTFAGIRKALLPLYMFAKAGAYQHEAESVTWADPMQVAYQQKPVGASERFMHAQRFMCMGIS